MEYGIALAIPLLGRRVRSGIKPIEDAQCAGMKWIIGRQGPVKTMRHMMKIPSMQIRCLELHERLRIHIRNLDPSHLLCEKISTKKSRHCRLLRKLMSPGGSNSNDVRDIKSFYKEVMRNENKSILSSMIETKNRAIDRCLKIKHAGIRRRAIRWRCSSKPLDGCCQGRIHESVSRRCVRNCFRPLLKPKIQKSFAAAMEEHTVDTYNILDHLLNMGMFKLFNSFFKMLTYSPRSS